MTHRELADVAGHLGEMRRAARANDAQIVKVSGNATLLRAWRLLEPFSQTYITLAAPGVDRHRIADLHEPLLDALRARDASRAADALDHHYTSAGGMLTDRWAEPGPATDLIAAERT